jgi:hypothetical protein
MIEHDRLLLGDPHESLENALVEVPLAEGTGHDLWFVGIPRWIKTEVGVDSEEAFHQEGSGPGVESLDNAGFRVACRKKNQNHPFDAAVS